MPDLMEILTRLMASRREDILKAVHGKPGAVSVAALQNDEAVATLARYSYALLPGVVRLAVREDAFRRFVMNNRDKLLAQLVQPAASV
ncbi:hypothetical protein ACFFTM_02025 [Pseudoduganella plicata]|uniref:Uncharacterized protein n=1 Tax=Pseudoduganella plicata TaxID=321984 RepID=A0A4P7BDM1_9BURK|nr:hypothetical protein [Pseudoduganella plicata]QBQ36786.1 hypothetical protein E1742_11870 [Pseudoduganella plicata]GGY72747.1 hypothetical protein GCM10007388_00970 [Pseudoduganella plicata]